MLHGQESVAFGDAGLEGVEKRPDATKEVTWHVAMRPGKRRALNKKNAADALIDKAEKRKAEIRAKVEHPKLRHHSLKKNTVQLFTLFALSNLQMARSELMGSGA